MFQIKRPFSFTIFLRVWYSKASIHFLFITLPNIQTENHSFSVTFNSSLTCLISSIAKSNLSSYPNWSSLNSIQFWTHSSTFSRQVLQYLICNNSSTFFTCWSCFFSNTGSTCSPTNPGSPLIPLLTFKHSLKSWYFVFVGTSSFTSFQVLIGSESHT